MPSFIDKQQSLAKERRFQEELMRSKKGLGDQVKSQSIRATPSGGVDPSGGQIASAQPQSITGGTSGDASMASDVKSGGGSAAASAAGGAAASMAGNAAGNILDDNGTTTSTGGGAAGGAAKGAASMAATGNPYLIAGAAIVGGITGGMKAKAARKKNEGEIQATLHEQRGKIEGQKADRLQEALGGLSSQFGRTLNNNQTLSL